MAIFLLMSFIVFCVIWKPSEEEKVLQTIGIVGTMAIQKGPLHPPFSSNSSILFYGSICRFLIFSMYSATLTSFMTTDPPPIKIKSLEDAANQNYEILCSEKSLLFKEITRKDSAFESIRHHFRFLNDEDVVLRLSDSTLEKVVYYGDPTWFQLQFKEFVTVVPEIAYNNHYFFGFQRDSEIALVMDYEIRKLRENGILDYLQRKWIPKKIGNMPVVSSSSDAFSLDMLHVGFLFLVLGMGCLTGFVMLVCEKVYHHKRHLPKPLFQKM